MKLAFTSGTKLKLGLFSQNNFPQARIMGSQYKEGVLQQQESQGQEIEYLEARI